MKKVLFSALAIAMSSVALAGAPCTGGNCGQNTEVGVKADAGAMAINNLNLEAGQPSPVVGLSSLPHAGTPQLNPLISTPTYLNLGPTLNVTDNLGEIVIGPNSIVQSFTDDEVATTVFSSAPMFGAYRSDAGNPALLAVLSPQGDPKVTWLGVVMVTSKDGEVLLPPYDMQLARNAVANVSNGQLREVIILPIFGSRAVTVGVKAKGNSFGLTSAFAKIVSMFIGVGPSMMNQNGTTMPTGTWGEQVLIFVRDENGVPLSRFVTKPPEQAKVKDKVAEARSTADALAKLRMETELTVPTQRVERERKPCKMEEFIDSAGYKVKMCRGSTSGTYGTFKVVNDKATARSVVSGSASTEKK